MWFRAALAAGFAALAVGAAGAETLAGRVQVMEHGRPLADLSGTFVWFEPEAGARAPGPTTAEITTRNRKFAPRAIAVPAGSTVRFPNQDPIQHNVFSISTGNRFDLGLYGQGPGLAQKLGKPGVVRIFCNVHRQMSAFVLVLDTPYFAAPDTGGRFSLTGIPAGNGTLHAWNPRCDEWSQAVRVPTSGAIEVALDATLPAVPSHFNKLGRPYRDDPDAPDDYK